MKIRTLEVESHAVCYGNPPPFVTNVTSYANTIKLVMTAFQMI